jgi:hypothetical protein
MCFLYSEKVLENKVPSIIFIPKIEEKWELFCAQCHHMSLMDFMVSLPGCGLSVTTSEVGTPMRRSYIVPMRWVVVYEF